MAAVRNYPALLLLYAGGIAAVAKERYGTLLRLLTVPRIADGAAGEGTPLVALAYLGIAVLLAACAKYATMSKAAPEHHHESHDAMPEPAN